MLFKISELGLRETVNMVDGAKMGAVKDVHIDLETGKVLSLVLSSGRKYFGLIPAGKDVEVPWEKIKKIGIHTVLVEVETQE